MLQPNRRFGHAPRGGVRVRAKIAKPNWAPPTDLEIPTGIKLTEVVSP